MHQEFWEDQLVEEPICKALVENWEAVRDEILLMKETHNKLFAKYPKFKIKDPETQESVRMYDNDWTITALSTLAESYEAENNRARKTGGDSLEKLIKRYRPKLTPVLHSIVNQPDKDGILTNIFISILSPGVIIRPHQGTSHSNIRGENQR